MSFAKKALFEQQIDLTFKPNNGNQGSLLYDSSEGFLDSKGCRY